MTSFILRLQAFLCKTWFISGAILALLLFPLFIYFIYLVS